MGITMTELSKLEQIRRKLGLTQAKFAKHLNTTESAISRYESKQRAPSAHLLAKLAHVLRHVDPPLSITIEDVLDDY